MLKEIDIELPLFYSNYWAQNTEYLRVHYIKIYIFFVSGRDRDVLRLN